MAIRFDDIGNRLKAFRLGSGLSADEIANRLNLSINTVKKHLVLALHTIRVYILTRLHNFLFILAVILWRR